MHPGALVQPRRAGRVRRIDAELRARDPPATELAERGMKQRERDPSMRQRAPNADQPHHRRVLVLGRSGEARRRADHLVAVDRDEPERRVVARALALDVLVHTHVERVEHTAPVILERLRERRVDTVLVALAVERPDPDAVVDDRDGWLFLERDLHHPEDANTLVPERLEEPDRGVVATEAREPDRDAGRPAL